MIPFARIVKYGNEVQLPPTVKQLEFTSSGVYLLYTNGELYYRGRNGSGNIGNGSSSGSYYNSWHLANTNVDSIARGISSIPVIRKNDNTFWMSGTYNMFSKPDFVQYTWNDVTTYFSTVQSNMVSMHGTSSGLFVLRTDGSLWAVGVNTNGQMGLGAASSATVFTQVASGVNPTHESVRTATSACFYITPDNKLYSTGQNNFGQLGIGSTTNATSFTLVNAGSPITTSYPVVKDVMAIGTGTNILSANTGDTVTAALAAGSLPNIGSGSSTGTSIQFNYFNPMNSASFKILKLATTLGSASNMLVMTDKGIYGTGNAQYYQLGNASSTAQVGYVPAQGLPADASLDNIKFFGSSSEGSACLYKNQLYVSGVTGQWGATYRTFTILATPYGY